MATYSAGTVTGPGGSVAWRLTGPAALVEAERFSAALQGALRTVIMDAAKTLKAEAQQAYAGTRIAPLFGYRTEGNAKRVQLTLFNTSPIFPYVEYDTRPHIIRARQAPYLVFQIGGRWVKVKQVRHPGTKGRYAVAALFAHYETQFKTAIQTAAQEVLSRGLV